MSTPTAASAPDGATPATATPPIARKQQRESSLSNITNSIKKNTDSFTRTMVSAPDAMLSKDGEVQQGPKSKFKEYIDERPSNAAEGVFKGLLSVGHGVFRGVTGIVVEPIKAVDQGGVRALPKGLFKGVTGVILRPAAGIIQFASKTTQGFLNTPTAVLDLMQREHIQEPDYRPEDLAVVEAQAPKFFGIPLGDSIQNAVRLGIPHVATVLIERIRSKSMRVEGIFRVPGSRDTIIRIKKLYDSGVAVDLEAERLEHSDVASLLKLYLRELPEPVLTVEGSVLLMHAQQIKDIDSRVAQFISVIRLLPPENLNLLQHLTTLLVEITANAATTLMNAQNLGIIFGQVLIHHDQANLMEVATANSCMITIIQHFATIFPEEQ